MNVKRLNQFVDPTSDAETKTVDSHVCVQRVGIRKQLLGTAVTLMNAVALFHHVIAKLHVSTQMGLLSASVLMDTYKLREVAYKVNNFNGLRLT